MFFSLNGTHTYHYLKGHNTQHIVVKRVTFLQNELMVAIYSKSLVRAISKVLRMTFFFFFFYLEHQLKHINVLENGLCL